MKEDYFPTNARRTTDVPFASITFTAAASNSMSEPTHIKEGGQLPLERTLSSMVIMITLSTQFAWEKENARSMSWSELNLLVVYCVS